MMNMVRRSAWIVILALPLVCGCPQNSTCGDLDPFSMTADSPGTLTINLAGGPADGSLLLTIAGQRFTGSPANPGGDPTTYEFFNLPSGTWDAKWEISGCGDEAKQIAGPQSVTIQ